MDAEQSKMRDDMAAAMWLATELVQEATGSHELRAVGARVESWLGGAAVDAEVAETDGALDTDELLKCRGGRIYIKNRHGRKGDAA